MNPLETHEPDDERAVARRLAKLRGDLAARRRATMDGRYAT